MKPLKTINFVPEPQLLRLGTKRQTDWSVTRRLGTAVLKHQS